MERETLGERVFTRVMALVAGLLLIVIIVIYNRDVTPKNVTLGMLANTANDYSGRRVVIRNAGNGKAVGRFLVFGENGIDRSCVVFACTAEVKPGCTTFRGYVLGVVEERIPGLDHNPPFLLVLDAKPMDP